MVFRYCLIPPWMLVKGIYIIKSLASRRIFRFTKSYVMDTFQKSKNFIKKMRCNTKKGWYVYVVLPYQ